MASVQLQDLSKSYGAVQVIRGLNLSVPDGSFTALLGPSGCGKSTLLRMIAGLEEITAGTAIIGGTDITREAPAKRGVSMVFQNYALYPHLTVEQNICFSMSLAHRPKAEQKEKAAQIAKMLQLESLMDRRPAQLSGGQRQRVAIGRALVRDPKVFLFDEPLSNLDAMLRVQMRLELAKLHQDIGTTMIYVTHDQVEAMTLADQIVVLNKGVIQQVGTPLELYNSPANRFVAGFIGSPSMNFLPVTVKCDGLAMPGGGQLNALPEAGVTEVGIRPEHLQIAPAGQGDVQGVTRVVEQLGNTSYVYIDTHAGTLVAEAGMAPSPGAALGVTFDLSRLHHFDANGNVLRG